MLAAVSWSLILFSSLAYANPVDPPEVTDALAPSQFTLVEKTVQTPEIPPRPDIVFLSDTTGSMGAEMDYQGKTMTRLEVVKKLFLDFVLGNKDTLPGRPNNLIGMIAKQKIILLICAATTQ